MTPTDRRGMLRASAGTLVAGLVAAHPARAQSAAPATSAATLAAPSAAPSASPGAVAAKGAPPAPVTRLVARYAATATVQQIPEAVRKEATRTLLNWVGCAVGGSHQDAPTRAVAALQMFSGPPQAGLMGRRERLDVMNAALINGISSHVLDYDDTHLKTIIHPAGPVASALTAFAEHRPVSGAEFMNALWLSPVGLKVQFGSDTKSFHPGKAAQNGLQAALLAEQGFTASKVALEGFDGWAQAASTRHNWDEVIQGLGERYEIGLNTYKPFACGIVAHPAIDAAIQLREAHRIQAAQVQSVSLKAHPLVLNLMGKTSPAVGLEGKFSIYHAVAVALATGRGGEQAFSDKAVQDPTVVALRQRVQVAVDPAIQTDQVDMTVTLMDGQKLHLFIEHAVGSQLHPMSDAQLEGKFNGLTEDILPQAQSRQLMGVCWDAWQLKDAGDINRAAAARA